jgi:arylsulfatase A-like enzyme
MPNATDRSESQSDVWNRPWAYLLLGLWFGLLTGLTESLFYLVPRCLHLIGFSSMRSHYEWLPSITYMVLFGVTALCLGLLGRLLPSSWPRKWLLGSVLGLFLLAFLYAFIEQLDLLLKFGTNWFGQLMLAVGLVSVLLPKLLCRPERLFKGLVYSLPVLGLIVALWSGWVHGGQAWQERRMVAELKPRPQSSPNVLLIVLDAVRAPNMSLYGHSRPTTPNLERLAASSVVFDNAISGSSWTLPGHVAMFTGLHVRDLPRLELDGLPEHVTTLAEALHAQDYLTAGFVGNLSYGHRYTGLAQGFAHYNDHFLSFSFVLTYTKIGRAIYSVFRDLFGLPRFIHRKSAEQVNKEFLAWRDRHPDRPFFAFLNYFEAHYPYLAPPPFDALDGPISPAEYESLSGWLHKMAKTEEDIETGLKAYDRCITCLDDQIQQLLAELERRGELDNTLVIITSDHGEEFGEHNHFTHGNSLYHPQVHVPLLMRLPGRLPAGQRIEEYASLTDLPATILDILGQRNSQFPGRSLAACWDTSQPPREPRPVLTELDKSPFHDIGLMMNADGAVRAIYFQGKKYLRKDADGQEELYDLKHDPEEKCNLVAIDSPPPSLLQFRKQLAELVPQLAPGLDGTTPIVASPIKTPPTRR